MENLGRVLKPQLFVFFLSTVQQNEYFSIHMIKRDFEGLKKKKPFTPALSEQVEARLSELNVIVTDERPRLLNGGSGH